MSKSNGQERHDPPATSDLTDERMPFSLRTAFPDFDSEVRWWQELTRGWTGSIGDLRIEIRQGRCWLVDESQAPPTSTEISQIAAVDLIRGAFDVPHQPSIGVALALAHVLYQRLGAPAQEPVGAEASSDDGVVN
jgi:hypothetical protein